MTMAHQRLKEICPVISKGLDCSLSLSRLGQTINVQVPGSHVVMMMMMPPAAEMLFEVSLGLLVE